MAFEWLTVGSCSFCTVVDLCLPYMRSGTRWYVFWAVYFSGASVLNVAAGWLPTATAWAALGGANAWLSFKQRPPRKRNRSKVAASIKDLGHRLVLVPVGGES